MIGMKFAGAEQFSKQLQLLSPSKQRGALNKMLIKAGEVIRQGMEDRAPVEPGKPDLKDHIAIKSVSAKEIEEDGTIGKRIREDTEAVVAIGPQKEFFYSWYLEFGTVMMGAQPFVRPAFDADHGKALKAFEDEVWAFIRARAQSGATTGRNL